MSTIIALLLVLGFVALLVTLAQTIRGDGFGLRPGPRSRHTDLPRWRQLEV